MIILRLLILLILCFPSNSIFSMGRKNKGLSKRQKRELLALSSKDKDPAILLDGSVFLTAKEFLKMDVTLKEYSCKKLGDLYTYNGDFPERGLLCINTQDYRDSFLLDNRIKHLRNFRENELQAFFGYRSPKIMTDKESLTIEEFLNLPEEDVAFINYYPSDLVRRYYGVEAENGIVYICKREKKSSINYSCLTGMPANGRNYIQNPLEIAPSINGGDNLAVFSYVQKKTDECALISKDLSAEVTFGCTIHLDGTVEPFIVECIKCDNKTNEEQLDLAIHAIQEIIKTIPHMDLGDYVLDEDYKNQVIIDFREKYLRIPVTIR